MRKIKKVMKKKTLNTVIAVLVLGVFVISLIPIFTIGTYNHASADDFSDGASAYNEYKASGNVFKTIKVAATNTKHVYNTWQGTFSAVFLMSLQPAVFGDSSYAATTYILIIALVIGVSFLLYQVIVRLLKQSFSIYIICTVIILTIQIQLVPSPTSAFFWFTGSIYYTFFYSLSMILLGLVACIHLADKISKKILLTIIASLLSFVVGGGNFVTVLFTLCILGIVILADIFMKTKNFRYFIFIFAASLIALFISASAPGNTVRQQYLSNMGAVESIYTSIKFGIKCLVAPPDFLVKNRAVVFLGALLVTLFMKDILFSGKYKYNRPIAFFSLTFLLFCTQFTPTLYSMSSYGPDRLHNIYYYTYVLYILSNVIYLFGWIYNKIPSYIDEENCESLKHGLDKGLSKFKYAILACGLVVILVTTHYSEIPLVTEMAVISLYEGEPQQYGLEHAERLELLENDDKNITIKKYSVKPELLFSTDIGTSDWRNIAMTQFYGKESINIVEP